MSHGSKLLKFFWILRLHSWNQFVQKLCLVLDFGIINDFGDQVLLVVGTGEILVSILIVKQVWNILIFDFLLRGQIINFQIVLNTDALTLHKLRQLLLLFFSLAMLCRVFYHLFGQESLIKALAQGWEIDLGDVDVDVLYFSDDGLELGIFYASKRSEHMQYIIGLLVLFNGLHWRVMMLLITQKDVIE